MLNGLNFASHDTMIAVNPRPPMVFSVTVWSSPPTIRNAAIPQSAPENSMVLIMTFFTLMPMYLAVFSLSPTTEIS